MIQTVAITCLGCGRDRTEDEVEVCTCGSKDVRIATSNRNHRPLALVVGRRERCEVCGVEHDVYMWGADVRRSAGGHRGERPRAARER